MRSGPPWAMHRTYSSLVVSLCCLHDIRALFVSMPGMGLHGASVVTDVHGRRLQTAPQCHRIPGLAFLQVGVSTAAAACHAGTLRALPRRTSGRWRRW